MGIELKTEKGNFVVIDLNNHLRLKILYNANVADNKYLDRWSHFTGRQKEQSKDYHKAVKQTMKSYSMFSKYFDKEFKKKLSFIGGINEISDYHWSLIIDSENKHKEAGLLLMQSKGIEISDSLIIAKII